MIKVTDISKKYGNRIIFENISCSLENQRIYALVGVNGIGKSTLLNAITQPASMDSGKVEIDGIDNREFKSKFQFFYVPDSKEMFLNLTGNEYLKCIIQLYRQNAVKAKETLERLSTAFKLERSLNEYIANYSLGMKQKVYLIAAFLSGAGNLILDEPFNGLDPESVATLKNCCLNIGTLGILYSFQPITLIWLRISVTMWFLSTSRERFFNLKIHGILLNWRVLSFKIVFEVKKIFGN